MANELQVSLENSEGLKRTLRVAVPANKISSEISKRLKQVGKKAKLKGFRPGKAPMNVIRQNYGDQIQNEVLNELMQSSYSEALSTQELVPAGNPVIDADEYKENNDFSYTATLEVYPEVELQGLDSLKVERITANIEDSDVNLIIDNMRHQKAEWKTCERAAADKDRVVIDFEGKVDGEVFPGGAAEKTPVILGEGRMLPDFEKGLLGIKANETREIPVSFPDDYHSEDLQGKLANFAITAHSVEEKVLPEINEEFCKGFGVESGDVDQLRIEVRENMQQEMDVALEAKLKDSAMTALLESNPIDVPEALVNQEIHSLQHDMQRRMGLPDDHSYHPPAEQFIDEAKRRVRLGLLIGEYVKKENLKVEKDDIDAQLEKLLSGYEDQSAMQNAYRSNPQAMQQVQMMALEAKVVTSLVARAAVTDEASNFQSVMDVKPVS